MILWWLVAIVAIILIGVIIYINIVISYQERTFDLSLTPQPLTSPVGFLYRCKTLTCDNGLTCDSIYGVCKYNNETVCNRGSQCLNGGICSGVCVVGPPASDTGIPNDPCPCPENMICSSKTPGSVELSCKLNAGADCTSNGQCFSNLCEEDGICAAGLSNGSQCTADQECLQNLSYCSTGFCQPIGIETGDNGASCNINTGPSCNSGLACVMGICQVTPSGLSILCDVTGNLCSLPLGCRDVDNENLCSLNSGACMCQFNFEAVNPLFSRPAPNTCPNNGCIDGYTCSINNCIAPTTQPCVVATDCTSNSCLNKPNIYQGIYTFRDIVSGLSVRTTDPTLISGSFNVEWLKISTGFSPDNVLRLTATAVDETGNAQVFYVVPGSQILPTQTGIIKSDGNNAVPGWWTQSIGNVINEFTLIDGVVFGDSNNIQALVAYNQLSFVGPNPPIQNYVLYLASGTSLTPFNPTVGSGLPGTQYSGLMPLTISNIDQSNQGDILILDNSNVLYTKPANVTTYSKVGLTGIEIPRFYSGGVSYVGEYIQSNTNFDLGEIMQFNGVLLGLVFPIYVIPDVTPDKYTVFDQILYESNSGNIRNSVPYLVALNQSNNLNTIFIAPNGVLEPLPGYVDPNSRVGRAPSNGSQPGILYLYTSRSCS